MKKRKFKKRFILFLILVVAVICYFIFFPSKVDGPGTDPNVNNPSDNNDSTPNNNTPIEPETYLNKIDYNNNTLNSEVEKVIISYMDLYYKGLQKLEYQSEIDNLFVADNEQSYINKTAISMLIDIRSLQPTDLKIYKASYDLKIESVSTVGGDIKVVLRENSYLNFNFMKDIDTKVYNIKNEFTITSTNNGYKIVKYNKVQDFFVMISEYYNSASNYKTSLDNLKNNYLTNIRKRIATNESQYQDYLNGTGIQKKTCDHGYDRDKAGAYAKKWVNTRNSEWPVYDSNCQNFASQMIYEGGIPMDDVGSSGDNLQWSSNKTGGSFGLVYTWTYVPSFYQYVKNNTGYGLCGSVDVNLYYAEPGDVIHMGVSAPTRHVSVVSGLVYKNGKVVDILVNSNTVDLENYPMSAYVYPYTSLIKIYGWNE